MRTIVKVLDVEIQGTQKGDMAAITVKSPGAREAVTLRMFPKDVQEGKHQVFQANVGKTVVTDIESELYNGSLQYRLSFGFVAVTYSNFLKSELARMQPAPAPAAKAS